MSSTLVSNIHDQQLPRFANFWGSTELGHSREGKCFHTPPLLSSEPYRGAQISPSPVRKVMSRNDGNPLLNPSLGGQSYQRVPVVASNAPTYASAPTTSDITRVSSTRQPFYNSYISATRPQSPLPPQKEHAAQSEQTARRRASGEGNSIASHLQIPSSINDSKGSLPEFAAQITCFFWFESSFTIRYVEDATASPAPITSLVPEASPTTGFRKWVTTILSMTQVSQNVILLALMFIYRLKRLNPGVKGKVGSEFRLLTVALMLGNKFLDDNTYTNKTWAEVSGISVQEIHVMEVEFLSNMRYTLFASEEDWTEWHMKLGKFSDYYDKASRVQTGFPNLALPAPQLTMPRDLPSPPISTNTSPPYLTHPTPNVAALPHPLSMPPYLPPRNPSPDSSLRHWSRKRSLEENSSEPPAKRLNSLAPSNASSTTLTPSTLNNTPPVPRLPLPNLSISTGQPQIGHSSSPGSLPMPTGRAMASVFPVPHSRNHSSVHLPSLQPTNHPGYSGGVAPTTGADFQPRQTPYASAASTPSPTAHQFPQHGPTGLSPSGWPMPRSSPYKPLRGVNTLLVPPPSASIHNQPQNVSHGQMHYQPLGKPVSERRSGVLPYFPFNTWVKAPDLRNVENSVEETKKGGDDTFGGFPEHLRALSSHALPKITVKAVVYPKFETRGDLKECVGRFRDWLQNKVIDLEVAAATPSPTVDPSVRVLLIGHSMGGIVAAETLLTITSDAPISSHSSTDTADLPPSMAAHTEKMTQPNQDSENHTLMFPYIQGILAFDTPYLGISPGVVAHSAEQHYKTATGAYSALSEVAGAFGYGASKKETPPQRQQDNQKLLTQGADAMSASMTNASSDAAATPTWQRWGKYAMFAGAAGAVAAGGAAAYLKRDTITEGWSYIGSHLEFVGCLAKGEELKSRLDRIVKLNKELGVGFADLITVLGKAASAQQKQGTPIPGSGGFVEIGAVDGQAPSERTFCTIPKSDRNRKFFEWAKNDKAGDEMAAHMTMFTARDNTGYFALGERARDLVVEWVDPEQSEWYKESEPMDSGKKKVMMDVDLGGDDTNPWAGEEPDSLRLGEKAKAEAGESLDLKPPKLGRPKAEIAAAKGRRADTSGSDLDSKPRRKPPKLGRPKKEMASMKTVYPSSTADKLDDPSETPDPARSRRTPKRRRTGERSDAT
ncbi:hypothetical protein ACLMJK_000815 [Lecanora helva]